MTSPFALLNAAAGALPKPASPLGGAGAPPQIDHACLEMFDPKPADGGSLPGASRGKIDFQFNPKELTIAKSAKWERSTAKDAKSAGPPEFSGAQPCKMTIEMFFDASGTHDRSVVAAVEKLFSCCVPTAESLGQMKASPPLVVFKWGIITSFPGFITSVSAKYTLFASDGTPIRAVCTVNMEEMSGAPGKQNPTSGGAATRRTHQMVAGDSLASVAYREYGAPAMWRPLARYNQIDDPMRIPSGHVLLLPSADELLGVVV